MGLLALRERLRELEKRARASVNSAVAYQGMKLPIQTRAALEDAKAATFAQFRLIERALESMP